jgi:hypothetical protein
MYQYQMGPDGLQRYYTLGGSGGRTQPGEVRGRTKRDRALGLAGAAAGGLLGLAGESRSLGGFAGNIISGAEQGSRFGRGLANLATSRRRQARADMEQRAKDDYDKQRAQADFEYRQQNPSLATRMNPMNINRRRFEAEQGRLQQARETNQRTLGTNEQLGRDLASLGRAKFQQEKRRGRRRDDDPAVRAVQNIDSERLQPALDLLTGLGVQTPQQQAQAPQGQGQVQQAAGFNQTDKTVDEQLNAPENRDPYSNSVEAAQAQMGQESQQGGGGEQQNQGVPSRLQRRFETDEDEQRAFDAFTGGGQ